MIAQIQKKGYYIIPAMNHERYRDQYGCSDCEFLTKEFGDLVDHKKDDCQISLKNRVYDFIKANNGMSASVSQVANAIDTRYTWRKHSRFSVVIKSLIKDGMVSEIKGRYYT